MSRVRLLAIFLGLVCLPAWGQSPPDSGSVVITEVLYAPNPPSNEFIELYNRSRAAVNLGRLEYADENRDFAPVASGDTMLAPGKHVVLVRAPDAFESAFPSTDYLAPPGWDALNNSGDTVVLRHGPSGTVLDSVPYVPSWGGDKGRSLERIDPAAPSTAANFAASTAQAGATPGRRNSQYDPDETAPTPVFAEQTDPTTVTITLSEPVEPTSVTSSAFTLSSTRIRKARLRRDTVVVLSLASPPQASTLRLAGLQDRVGNAITGTSLPLGHQPAPDDVIINELLYAPRRDDFDDRPDQVEYVELLNRTDRPLTLNGLLLTDRPDEDGEADTLRPGRKRLLPPRSYGVVTAAPEGATTASASQLAAAFPDAPLTSDSVAYLPVDAARLGLRNDGDLVRVHNARSQPIAEVRYRPDWHVPELEETRGTALARISPSGASQSSDNWTSSPAPSGGTPGARNAVSLDSPPDAPSESITVAPSPFSIERDGATRIRYRLDGVPNLVRARIFDARGRKVRTLEDARLTGRTGELVWNGRNDDGNRVRIGVYVVLFEALDGENGRQTQLKAPVVVARSLN